MHKSGCIRVKKTPKNESRDNPICRRGDKADYRSDATYSDEIVSFKDPELEAKFKGADSIIQFKSECPGAPPRFRL